MNKRGFLKCTYQEKEPPHRYCNDLATTQVLVIYTDGSKQYTIPRCNLHQLTEEELKERFSSATYKRVKVVRV